MPSKIFAKFWDKVDQSGGPDACWPWTGDKHRKGYGRAFVYGLAIPAHRLALTLHGGEPESDNFLACHTCDNPPCCNPAHLWWGTNTENVLDAIEKGRWGNVARRLLRDWRMAMDDKTLVEEARAWPGVEWDALSAGKVGELLNKLADENEAQATRIEALKAALRRMIYETTHLSPMKPNGDHDCTIKADALGQARQALESKT